MRHVLCRPFRASTKLGIVFPALTGGAIDCRSLYLKPSPVKFALPIYHFDGAAVRLLLHSARHPPAPSDVNSQAVSFPLRTPRYSAFDSIVTKLARHSQWSARSQSEPALFDIHHRQRQRPTLVRKPERAHTYQPNSSNRQGSGSFRKTRAGDLPARAVVLTEVFFCLKP